MVGAVAVVIGAGGGIGRALVEQLAGSGRYEEVHALSRRPRPDAGGVHHGQMDVTDEVSIVTAAKEIGAPVSLVIVATGFLHDAEQRPERSLRDLDAAALARSFAVNTIGPTLVLKHFAPLLPKDQRAIIALLSARVGSISDNRTGGWYGYRASKAALNMVVRSAAIELHRLRPQAICVALHPGTVDTALSEPFQGRVPPDQLFSPERAARQLLTVLHDLTPERSGRILAWDGSEIDP